MSKFFKKNIDRNPHDDPSKRETGFLEVLKQRLSKTRSVIAGRLDRIFSGRKITEELLDELEEVLFTSDIGVVTTQELIASVREEVARKDIQDPQKLRKILSDHIRSFLEIVPEERPLPRPGEPLVIMVVGVNGVGKTTTIGKIAHRFKSEGKEVMLVAADTFRAAAAEQLLIWGERVQADVIRQHEGADPSAVVFDALDAAASRKSDVVLIDTAGRLHTKVNLMEQLQKLQRVAGRKVPGAPHEVWLVLDATTGQNAISQAEKFHKALSVSGIVLTKMDGTAKGGIVIGICYQLGIPISFIGTGESAEDLEIFSASDFVRAIFE